MRKRETHTQRNSVFGDGKRKRRSVGERWLMFLVLLFVSVRLCKKQRRLEYAFPLQCDYSTYWMLLHVILLRRRRLLVVALLQQRRFDNSRANERD